MKPRIEIQRPVKQFNSMSSHVLPKPETAVRKNTDDLPAICESRRIWETQSIASSTNRLLVSSRGTSPNRLFADKNSLQPFMKERRFSGTQASGRTTERHESEANGLSPYLNEFLENLRNYDGRMPKKSLRTIMLNKALKPELQV